MWYIKLLPNKGNILRRLFMKKSKLLVLGLITLMLAGGLILASCGEKCPGHPVTGNGECHNYNYTYDPKTGYGACTDDSCAVNKAIRETPIDRSKKCDC
jgi:hypothetical protein